MSKKSIEGVSRIDYETSFFRMSLRRDLPGCKSFQADGLLCCSTNVRFRELRYERRERLKVS